MILTEAVTGRLYRSILLTGGMYSLFQEELGGVEGSDRSVLQGG